jgi:hypothetical protein
MPGDVRRLAGHTIQVSAAARLYDSRAEIVLKRISPVAGGSTLIPPLSKDDAVEKTSHFSAGHIRPTKKPAQGERRAEHHGNLRQRGRRYGSAAPKACRIA